MRRSILVTIGVPVVTVALAAAGVAAMRWANEQRAARLTGAEVERGTVVGVAAVERREVPVRVSVRGFLEPFERLTKSAEVTGYIESQLVEVADRVEEGRLLFTLDSALHEVAVRKANAAVDRAESDLHFAEENRKRVRNLERDASANPQEVLRFETEFRRARAALAQANAAADEARLLLEKTKPASPLTGVVSEVYKRAGEFVRPGDPLATLIETERLKLIVQLDDREVIAFATGDRVSVTVQVLPGAVFEGRILRIHPAATVDSRKFKVEVEVPNSAGRLRPGFFARADLEKRSGASVLTIPRQAVFESYGRQQCYVVRESAAEGVSRAYVTSLEAVPVLSEPHILRVISGVEAGDRVVTTGLQHVTDACVVRVRD